MRTIELMLKEVALATQGVLYYGRGNRAYANLESDKYPRVWIHMVNPIDTLWKSGLLTSSYEVVGEVSSLIDFTSDISPNSEGETDYLDHLEILQGIYQRFITSLNNDSRNKVEIGRVTRREILHDYDDNVIGYVFTFTIQLKEQVSYQCPIS